MRRSSSIGKYTKSSIVRFVFCLCFAFLCTLFFVCFAFFVFIFVFLFCGLNNAGRLSCFAYIPCLNKVFFKRPHSWHTNSMIDVGWHTWIAQNGQNNKFSRKRFAVCMLRIKMKSYADCVISLRILVAVSGDVETHCKLWLFLCSFFLSLSAPVALFPCVYALLFSFLVVFFRPIIIFYLAPVRR